MKKTTGELLENLKSSKSYEDFVREERSELIFETLAQYLNKMLKEKNLTKAQAISGSNLDKNYAYQFFNGQRCKPTRDKLIMLAFGMRMSEAETQKMLKIAKLCELYVRDPRDSLIIYSLQHGSSLIDTNEKLELFGFDILE